MIKTCKQQIYSYPPFRTFDFVANPEVDVLEKQHILEDIIEVTYDGQCGCIGWGCRVWVVGCGL